MTDNNRSGDTTNGEPVGLDQIGDERADDAKTEKAIELPVEDGDSIGQPV